MATSEAVPLVLGIDLGGTKILAGVVDPEHQVSGRSKVSTPAASGPQALAEALEYVARSALQKAGVGSESVVGIGIGSPGPLDLKTGVIRSSPNLAIQDFPLKAELERRLGRPVVVQNDVRAGGYGEYKLGAGRGTREFLAVFVGTGIGGCLIRDGQILTGVTGNAGEIGHLVVKPGGPKCGCGRRGCLEALGSRTAITRRVWKAIKTGSKTSLSEVVRTKRSRLKSGQLAEAYQLHDPVALFEVERAAHYLGLAIGSIINLLGPELIVIGGGVAEALGQPFLQLITETARGQAMADPDQVVRIELSELGDDAGLLGAALIAQESLGITPKSGTSNLTDPHNFQI